MEAANLVVLCACVGPSATIGTGVLAGPAAGRCGLEASLRTNRSFYRARVLTFRLL